ncbi:MAG TPA: PHB depolymerase family esterase [Thermoanaerobaculia bacterium]|nr:PHB depolymerase family esterase [Thermoanaerobaculia bacterium]
MRNLFVGLLALPAIFALSEAIGFRAHNRNNGAIISSGQRGEFLVHVPRGYDPTRPTPLVISLHGAGGWPVQQMETSRWNALADEQRFIVAYPAASPNGGPRIWRDGDVRFIADLIDALEHTYNIDRKRIYANGLSNGGGMSFALSCTLSDRIAAVGLVAAAQSLPWIWCNDRRAVPMIDFHGTADPVVPYNGGVSWVTAQEFPSVPIWAAKWARRNKCAASAESRVASDVVLREYTRCQNDATVALYTIAGGGHTWPGGEPLPEFLVGRTTGSIDATRLMWAFFLRHPLS